MILLAVIPTMVMLTLVTVTVVWLSTRWKSISPGTRRVGVVAVVVLPAITTWRAWAILTRPEAFSALEWVLWGLLFLSGSAGIPLIINALKHNGDDH